MQMSVKRMDWEYASVFRISYKSDTHVATVVVELRDGDFRGRGEGIGVSYRGETADEIVEQLEAVRREIERGIDRDVLQELLPPGGARNAVDCALWDLEAKQAGRRAWELAGLDKVHPLQTDFTLSVDEPEKMGEAAKAAQQYALLKLKLTGDGDLERVAAVKAGHPTAQIIVDANQGWNRQQLHEFTPKLAELGVKLIEQPVPVGEDHWLQGFDSPVPLCADESCQTAESLPGLVGLYDYVNIKLDKTGGLTEALKLANAAKAVGFGLMVGCMSGSSLSMAPAFIIGQWCDFVDLDGPLLARKDVPDAIQYRNGEMSIPSAALWG